MRIAYWEEKRLLASECLNSESFVVWVHICKRSHNDNSASGRMNRKSAGTFVQTETWHKHASGVLVCPVGEDSCMGTNDNLGIGQLDIFCKKESPKSEII